MPISRLFKTEDDFLQMRALLMEGRARTADWRYAHVGLLAWDFFMVACHLDPQQHVRLWAHESGELLGYALLGEDPLLDWQVLPEHQWAGVEEEALAWAEERLAGLRQQDPAAWGDPLVCWARQDDAPRLAFLEARGFRYRGEFAEVDMIRSLAAPVPAPEPPPGYEVRGLAGPGEVPERADAYRDVWRPWSVGEVDDVQYASLEEMPGYHRELDVVAVAPDRTIAAYVNCWLDPVNGIGDFGPVGARPAYRRRGLTRAVLLEGMRRLRAAGMDRVGVSTGVANTAARSLYESVGFTAVNHRLDYVK